ncbi:maintenance of mitochondrial morphology protein 1 [Mycena amicta]|nr:maintenance of mitochondrial morphology protein 1 [Mycena amicta]
MNYIFSLQPTFTQGLVLGQLSILVLLYLVLKYLFLDSTKYPFETSSYHPRADTDGLLRRQNVSSHSAPENISGDEKAESLEWFSMLLHQVVEIYRSNLRDDLPGVEGDEVARKRVEDYANKIRPPGFLDYINVHSVDLGVSAPRLYNARIKRQSVSTEPLSEVEFDVSYTDTISLSLSTSCLFNYPLPSFARLPVSLTISLAMFKSSIIVTPPSTASPSRQTSLMGSRAKLANVPKLHELIQHQVQRLLASREPLRVALPGLSRSVEVRPVTVLKELKEEDL